MANFEVFLQSIKLSTIFLFLKSESFINYYADNKYFFFFHHGICQLSTQQAVKWKNIATTKLILKFFCFIRQGLLRPYFKDVTAIFNNIKERGRSELSFTSTHPSVLFQIDVFVFCFSMTQLFFFIKFFQKINFQ